MEDFKGALWPALLRVPLLTGVTFAFALIDGFIRRAALLGSM
jgi:hypothetical protein